MSMSKKSVWKGAVSFGLVHFEVKLYKAISDEKMALNLLNPKTGSRIEFRPVDLTTKEQVSRADLVKGYEYEPGQYVLISQDDLDGLKIESEGVLRIQGFLSPAEVSELYRDDVYYLEPDGSVSEEAYRTLRAAMLRKRKAGLSRIVMNGKEKQVLIEPFGEKCLILTTLRTTKQIRLESVFCEKVTDTKVPGDYLKLACELVDQSPAQFDPNFEDGYFAALASLVKRKIKEGTQRVATPKNLGKELGRAKRGETRARAVVSLSELLRASVEGKGKKREKKEDIETSNNDQAA